MSGIQNLEFSTSYERYQQRNGAVIAAFDAISHPNLFRVRPAEYFCNSFLKDRCINSLNPETVFYFDDDHPSDAGARLVVPAILKAVETIEARKTGAAQAAR